MSRVARARAVVSDHAVVRYLERVLRVDVDALRCEVLGLVEGGLERGAASVRRDGRSYVVDGGRIVTVLPKGGRAGARRRPTRAEREVMAG
ncbi:protein of unknown function [Beijerinckiaceae bacterium RH AL1]|nr:protein of unknown function [Beijerinckiaceae bacterium RH CH11]VVB44582.1 protein of unknown function [Beijerinckiaceae bacterium RH AL8]VVC54386.1 protein of unknown function [Beijerinckiaceae bacterium RH AL1]